jgi:hypothetical protein
MYGALPGSRICDPTDDIGEHVHNDEDRTNHERTAKNSIHVGI